MERGQSLEVDGKQVELANEGELSRKDMTFENFIEYEFMFGESAR